MADIKKGDRVRVTFEADVAFGSSFGVDLQIEDGPLFRVTEKSFPNIEFEKIEPPVETFGPGDMLRSLSTGSYWYLAANGYVRMVSPDFPNAVGFFEYADGIEEFTSDLYERVSLD